MDASEIALAEQLVADQVGRTASFRLYDRSLKSPMNSILDGIQSELRRDCAVYWVDGGLPEIFCLSGFSIPITIYNTRYVELGYLIRRLIGNQRLAAFRTELAERACLRVMAELAIRHGRGDWAVQALLKSIDDETLIVPDILGAALLDLEAEPKQEAYVLTWFFGLVHEFGHQYHLDGALPTLFTDDDVLAAVQVALEHMPYPAEIKHDALDRAKSGDNEYALSPQRLRSEAQADAFAILHLLGATKRLMEKLGGRSFRIEHFVWEVNVALNTLAILNVCKRTAMLADEPPGASAMRDDILFHPVSYFVRALLTRRFLELGYASCVFGTTSPTHDHLKLAERAINAIVRSLSEPLKQFEKGLARAQRFALFPEERPYNLMSRFTGRVLAKRDAGSGFALDSARRLVELASSFQVESDSLQALRRVLRAA